MAYHHRPVSGYVDLPDQQSTQQHYYNNNNNNNYGLYPPSTNNNNNNPFASSSDSLHSQRTNQTPTRQQQPKSAFESKYDDDDDDYAYPSPRARFATRPGPGGASAGKGGGAGAGVKKWIIAIMVILLLVAVGVGIAVWRVKAAKNHSSASSGSGSGNNTSSGNNSSSGTLQYIKGTASVVLSNPADPSQFQKDPNLKQSFWGYAYTPFNAQEPQCGATLANVTEDIQLLSQLTTRLRMYGSACNQSALVLEAIRQTKVNMTVWLGAYIGDNKTVNAQQQQVTLDVLRTYGTDHVEGVIIGNEYILNAESQSTAITYIINQVAAFKTQLAALNLAKTLPVGTADAGSVLTATLAKGVDFFMANVHPFFGGVPIAQGAAWTNEFFQENDVYYCNRAANSPTCYIAETGWPTASLTPANLTIGGATAGVAQLQTFLDTFVCQANANGTEYFYFEAFDEPWKVSFGGVEPFWGLMDSNKKMKAITIPSC